jgi:hypothetical protein
MKLSIWRDSIGLRGLYWCGATKTLALDITAHFAIRLQFAFTEDEKTRLAHYMLDHFAEKERLQGLNSAALVDEVMDTPAGDYEPVIEMADRLDPLWYERDPPARLAETE